jgi:hypothetical protein
VGNQIVIADQKELSFVENVSKWVEPESLIKSRLEVIPFS